MKKLELADRGGDARLPRGRRREASMVRIGDGVRQSAVVVDADRVDEDGAADLPLSR
jgi:hypothetical protein